MAHNTQTSSPPTPVGTPIINGIWMVSTSSIKFENSGGFLSVNGKVPRNGYGQACPWSQCVHTAMGPRSAGFFPKLLGHVPVIGLYGGGMITVWDGFDQAYVTNFRNDSNSWENTTHWVEAMMLPSEIGRDSTGHVTLRPTGTSYTVQGGFWPI